MMPQTSRCRLSGIDLGSRYDCNGSDADLGQKRPFSFHLLPTVTRNTTLPISSSVSNAPWRPNATTLPTIGFAVFAEKVGEHIDRRALGLAIVESQKGTCQCCFEKARANTAIQL